MKTIGVTSPVNDFAGAMVNDCRRALGEEVELLSEPVGVKKLTVEGYSDAIERVGEAAQGLVQRGASAIMVGGTSLTFFRGHEFHNQLLASVGAATGVPVSSTSQALIEALRAVKARRLAVATAYTEAVSELLRQFLTEIGFEFLSLRSMGFETAGIAPTVSTQEIVDFSRQAFDDAPEADCLLISCAGLRTLDATVPLEKACGVPVVSSYQSTIWGVAKLAGVQPAKGFGRLLDAELAAAIH
ncbi:MAG TPA: aspartate/glutamate racemase family protein [Chloroflexota bacterium]